MASGKFKSLSGARKGSSKNTVSRSSIKGGGSSKLGGSQHFLGTELSDFGKKGGKK